jgi:hypothetical protein
MGEKKRRAMTLEPVSQLEVFDPRAPETGADRVKREAVIQSIARVRQRPTAICGACDYEFRFGELPARLYVLRPFTDPDEPFEFLSGFVCRSCVDDADLVEKIFGNIRKHNPHLQLLQPGSA